MDLFQVWLPDDVIRRIVSIHPPHHLSGPDKIAWVGSASRSFSIKSAYRMLREGTWNSSDDAWHMVEQKRRGIGKKSVAWYVGVHRRMSFTPLGIVPRLKKCGLSLYQWKNKWSVDEIIKGLYSWAVQCSSSLKVSHSMRQNVRMSVNGEGSWICLNSDGTLKLDFGLAAAGAVLRDCHGGCFLGFIRNLGHCSVFNAKL
ncbi:hypothetical protein Goklo_021003 [Gossypium klotzschianum]|uniref:RNase H type-1 domain-containing protein n=1 Tax=Gossypium klotzschianum TaxID=34286 RepID=A0A7J8UTZ5_9ROSI|nr:hypothetical protein [Gossypium klotzschianum]